MNSEPFNIESPNKPKLFSIGYRACDAFLMVLTFGCPVLVYISLNNHVAFSLKHILIASISFIAILALLRVRVAFALIALPFFAWAGYSVVRGFLFPPTWASLFNPIYVGGWAISMVIEYFIGAYFWEKYSVIEFSEWASNVFERLNK